MLKSESPKFTDMNKGLYHQDRKLNCVGVLAIL